MPDWRIRKRYGHGSARVVLCPEPSRGAASGVSFVADLHEVGLDLFGGVKTGVVFGVVILATFLFTAMRDRTDFSSTQLAMWRSRQVVAEVEPPAPVPKPTPLPAKPKPVVEEKIAKVEPKPEPVPKAKPKPEPVKVAEVAPPKPVPVPKPVAKITPKARKPKIEIAGLAKRDVSKAAPIQRQRIVAAEPERRKRVALAAPAMNSPALPEVTPDVPSREQRITHQPERRSVPVPLLAVAQTSMSLPEATSSLSPQRGAPAFAPARSKARPNVQLAAAASPVIATASPATSSATATRLERPAAVVANTNSRRPADIGSAPAALAARAPVAPMPAQSRVSARSDAISDRSRGTEPGMSLQGVSLGSLASCVSDQEEDLLKQHVLAAVRNRKSCESSFGTYRFVETKNLNAFSMWIERSPGREASDRCVELTHALACLE